MQGSFALLLLAELCSPGSTEINRRVFRIAKVLHFQFPNISLQRNLFLATHLLDHYININTLI